MTILEAIILGIIQGLSEFIPISSTAHLTIAGQLMGLVDMDNPEKWTAFIAVIQLGTLAAVLAYFARDIKNIPAAFLSENIGGGRKKFSDQSHDSRMGWLIIIGSVPIVVVGLGLKDLIESGLTKDPMIIASSLIVLAIILAFAERIARFAKDIKGIGVKDSLVVGFAQCLALIPGSSRSGTTITAGLFLGMKRDVAARFSFLLSIPAVFGSGVLEFYQSLEYLQGEQLLTLAIATVASALSGYAAIAFLIRYLKTRSTMLFVWYRIGLGGLVFYLAFNGIL
jgi:undecaprenyl-diphosphatase